MNPIEYNSVQGEMSMFMADLADSNYYNPRLQVIRVFHPLKARGGERDEFFDFRLAPTWYPPNPKDHKILLITMTEQITSFGLSEERLKLPPGIQNQNGDPANIPVGLSFIFDRNQRITTTDSQNGSSAFSISGTSMDNDNTIKVALSPPLPKPYNNSETTRDSNQVGVFMTNKVAMIRSKGGQITLGDEGIHLGGKIFWESTVHSKEIMQDNFIHQLVPSTIPTSAIAIPQLPNFGMIAQIADAANKVLNIIGITGDVVDAIAPIV